MTDAEMACCQKMAGNCDMGTGKHSCCKTTVSVTQSMAAVIQRHADTTPVAIAVSIFLNEFSARSNSTGVRSYLPAISISPPGSLAILRI